MLNYNVFQKENDFELIIGSLNSVAVYALANGIPEHDRSLKNCIHGTPGGKLKLGYMHVLNAQSLVKQTPGSIIKFLVMM